MPRLDPRSANRWLQAKGRVLCGNRNAPFPHRSGVAPAWRPKIGQVAVVFALSGALTGCALDLPGLSAQGMTQDPRLPPAELPIYEIGDIYVYSDGHVETVANKQGDLVTWKKAGGQRVDRSRDYVVAELSASAHGGEGLWPLRVGNRSQLPGKTAVLAGGAGDGGLWHCAVTRTRTGRFLAGDLDTYRIRCRDGTADPGVRVERVWYHAPTVGHPVMQIDKRGTEQVRRQLVAVLPGYADLPKSSQAAARQTLQTALEELPGGQSEQWRDGGSGTSVRVTPLTTFQAGNGSYCRGFQKIVDGVARTREYRGIACRNADGIWRPPGI